MTCSGLWPIRGEAHVTSSLPRRTTSRWITLRESGRRGQVGASIPGDGEHDHDKEELCLSFASTRPDRATRNRCTGTCGVGHSPLLHLRAFFPWTFRARGCIQAHRHETGDAVQNDSRMRGLLTWSELIRIRDGFRTVLQDPSPLLGRETSSHVIGSRDRIRLQTARASSAYRRILQLRIRRMHTTLIRRTRQCDCADSWLRCCRLLRAVKPRLYLG